MHSLWQRVNMMATVSLSVTTGMVCALAVSTAYFELWQGLPPPRAAVELGEVHRLWSDPRGFDTAMVSVRVDADLRSLWHWNVKQIFCFVVAEYRTSGDDKGESADGVGRLNEVILWDHIVRSEADAVFKFGVERPIFDYFLQDKGKGLRGTNFTLRLRWNIMPHTGFLYFQEKGSGTFTIPGDTAYVQPQGHQRHAGQSGFASRRTMRGGR
eukprot:TRINITY_DN61586_c0_g1_i1.p1 TRINITY_DN61586_c0_g1~~TRINITY_DN61586_c0_g1_i1.p1  ORF type:complete len:240 (+),score=80.34 TRINITY_DN61586_c0_g1_i1:85-720(+)